MAFATLQMNPANTVTFQGHGLRDGDTVVLTNVSPGTTGITEGVQYVVASANNTLGTFKMSGITIGGSDGTADYTTMLIFPDTTNDQTFFSSPTDWNSGAPHLIPAEGALPTPAPTPGGGGGTFSSFSG